MHDGLSFAREEAIQRHGGHASDVRRGFVVLSADDKTLVMKFLDSL